MLRNERDNRGHRGVEHLERSPRRVVEAIERIERIPQRSDSTPLRVRIKRFADGAAQTHAHPRRWMRILFCNAEHESARKAQYSHEPERGSDTDGRNRPKVRDDLRDPPL